jgi:prevent-host-death family protein
MNEWQIQKAKARLSEVLKRTESEDLHNITLHGQPVAPVISPTLSERLTGNEQSLIDFMSESPTHGLDDLILERNASLTREALR